MINNNDGIDQPLNHREFHSAPLLLVFTLKPKKFIDL
jgi:hypothetical protein